MTVMMKAKEAANQVYAQVAAKTAEWSESGRQPGLAVLLVEGDPASAYYAEAKRKIAERLGVGYRLHAFPHDATEESIMQTIDRLNRDQTVHGILLELPLPKHMSASRITQEIAPAKDIDGVTPAGKLAVLTGQEGLYPATPQACIRLLKHYGYMLEGKHVALIGRGQTVGMPLFHMLQRENATVTVCHSRTPDIALHLRHADVAFVAVGRRGAVGPEMIHSELVIVDAGINEAEDGTITGDVAAEAVPYAAAISPVPGGVGTLTTAILFENLLKAMDRLYGKAGEQ